MNVLHLTHTDTRYDNRILKELNALANTGLYNLTCIGVASNEGASMSSSNRELNIELITLTLITKLPKWFPRVIRHTLMLAELYIRLLNIGVRKKPNLIHCHDTMVLPVGKLIKKITKAKLIYDAHELESDKNGQSRLLSKATLFIEKRCWSSIDHFISVSNSIIKWYEKNLGVKSNTLILNSPLISKVNSASYKYFHNLYDIPHNKLVFVYLGILGHGRGIDSIIEAFCDEKIQSHIVFIGYGEYEAKIKDISNKKINIHLHDSVPHEKVVSIVKNADIGLCLIENVSLSDYYCLPNKLFEYTFARLPILASNFPDIKELVVKYNLGNVCDIDSRSINKAIRKMELNPPKRLTSDLTDLGWTNQAEKLTSIYKELFMHY